MTDSRAQARGMVVTSMSSTERALLDEARQLLAIATNRGSYPNERIGAYRRISAIMDSLGLIAPTSIVAQIETISRGELTASGTLSRSDQIEYAKEVPA